MRNRFIGLVLALSATLSSLPSYSLKPLSSREWQGSNPRLPQRTYPGFGRDCEIRRIRPLILTLERRSPR